MLQQYLTEFRRLLKNTFAAYGVAILWVMCLMLIFATLNGGASIVDVEPLSVSLRWLFKVPAVNVFMAGRPGLSVFMMLVAAPLIEEAVFRFLPLTVFEDRNPRFIRAVVVCFCGVFFGWLHGSSANILIQGFVGMMLGFLYLKNGPNQLSSYLTCAAMHSAYNFTVLSIALAW